MRNNIKKNRLSIKIIAQTVLWTLMLGIPFNASAAIIFQDDDFHVIRSKGILIDDTDWGAGGDYTIQFGQTLAETFSWDDSESRFSISDDLDLTNNQLTTARVENVAALPGGAVGLGAGGIGRVVQLTATDSTAPGCTGPSCAPASYAWNGSIWVSLTGSTTVANSSKIITVGPTGRDYTTIAAGATYLNTLSGGEMWIDPGTYPVTASVDLENIRVVGVDSSQTTISITGSGQFEVRDTKFNDVTINVDAGITADMGLDIKYNASYNTTVEFDQVDFIIGSGKYLIDSSAATAPTLIAQLVNCTESSGAGYLVKTTSTANLNASSDLLVIDQFGTTSLKVQDWDVTIIGGSNVLTSGSITTIPDRTIYVSPGMNIQGAINSLGSRGGTIKLLIGTHDITSSLSITNDNIELSGEGPGTIVRAQSGTWTGGTTNDDAVLNVGVTNGTSPRTNVIVKNFKIQVGPNIHGIQVNGGQEIKIMDMIMESIAVKTNTRVGILFTDGSATAGSRFTASRNIINSDNSTDRWVDGIHFDGNADFSGQLFGYGNGIVDSIIYESIVSEARETAYAFSQVSASSVYSNRARNIGFVSTALGMFFNDCTDVMIINNTMEGANDTATGISLWDNVDNSIVMGNAVRGGPTNYSIGVNIASSTSSGNIIEGNQFASVNTRISDSGTNTKLESNHHRSTSAPTVNDDVADGFEIGTIWIDTTNDNSYISVDHTAGAAIWKQMDSTTASAIITGSTPPVACTSGAAGRQFMDTDSGLVYICDSTRNKWLSQSEMVLSGEESGTCSSGASIGSDGDCGSNWGANLGGDNNTDLGIYLPYNATITGIGFSQDNDACSSGSLNLEIWGTGTIANDNNYSLASTVISGITAENYASNSLSSNLNGGQYIIWGIDNNCGQDIDDWNMVIYFRYHHPDP